jgi:K+-sensing histidine kinase KdpD
LVSLITIGALWAAPIVGIPNLIIVYVLAVVFSALRWGRRAAVFSAISSALLFDYFSFHPTEASRRPTSGTSSR